jgi:hypothetical protein
MPRHGIRTLGPTLLALTLVTSALPAVAQDASPTSTTPEASAPTSVSRAAFHDAMRSLWEDHITWTRLFIVSAATADEALPDLKATTERLLQNQVDIGDAIKPFYGDAAGEQLTSLLKTHITTAADLVTAAKAGDKQAAKKASDAWYANADEIATFLNGANPDDWPLADAKAMMKEHLELTEDEATAQIEGRFADGVADYDKVRDQILEMADMLSDGIIAQFPERFTS